MLSILSFQPEGSSLSFLEKVGLVVMDSLSFFLNQKMSWFLPHFWRTILLHIELSTKSFFHSVLLSTHCLWPLRFKMRNCLIILLKIPCMWWAFSLVAFKILFLWLSTVRWLCFLPFLSSPFGILIMVHCFS